MKKNEKNCKKVLDFRRIHAYKECIMQARSRKLRKFDTQPIALAMTKRGWQQTDLARATRLSDATVYRILTGKTQNSRNVRRCAEAVNVPMDDVVIDADLPSSEDTQ